jgi:FlaA1/EpsC-like NDP-sugar epimerase
MEYSSFLHKVSDWYFTRRALPYWLIGLLDCLLVIFSYILTFTLLRSGTETLSVFGNLFRTLCVYLIFYIIGFKFFHTYEGILRYSSFVDLQQVSLANLMGALLTFCFHYLLWDHWGLIIITGTEILVSSLIATLLMMAMRILVKLMYELSLPSEDAKKAFVYGDASDGIGIAKHIRNEKPMRFILKGFITDDTQKEGIFLMGEKVYLMNDEIINTMIKKDIRALIISPQMMNKVRDNSALQDKLLASGIHIFTIQDAQELNRKEGNIKLNEISIEDLLPRDEIQIDMNAIKSSLEGKRIMVTGSAGSIGSEMVRLLATFKPSQLILIDQAETPQHNIRLMMKKNWPDIPCETIVTTITHKKRMESIFRTYCPEYVFHAAAYKHVPMMEDNPCESVINNIYGTKVIADLSVKYGVNKFVMISTDKAVNPTNVMGCSKRICEMYVQSLSEAIAEKKITGKTQFITTRFGNVLGSNGSVIPLFKAQIANGGPVTVTDPRIIRYFMLIPEACELVLEAGVKGQGGQIFVFDMGKPVKIDDLARKMIKLSGARNIEIKYIGLRAGEKLYEEVLNKKEEVQPTFNKKIFIAAVRKYPFDKVNQEIEELIEVSENYDDMATVTKMKEIVPEYISNNSIYHQLDEQELKKA